MLVIGRRAGESILIGEEIEVQLIEISGSRVKLGIRAPRCLTVLRKEIKLAADQNREAAQGWSAETLAALLSRLQR
jgi:carbon storage regulator